MYTHVHTHTHARARAFVLLYIIKYTKFIILSRFFWNFFADAPLFAVMQKTFTNCTNYSVYYKLLIKNSLILKSHQIIPILWILIKKSLIIICVVNFLHAQERYNIRICIRHLKRDMIYILFPKLIYKYSKRIFF